MRAALYARFSSDRQNPRSCADQVAALVQWCAGKGWPVVATYQDEGVSGTEIAGRRGWQELLAEARGPSCRFEVVVIEDLDRWGRDHYAAQTAFGELAAAGVRVATPAGGIIDLDTAVGQMQASFGTVYAAEYSRNLSIHTKRGMAARIGVVSKAGGQAPFGYRSVPDDGPDGGVRMEIDETAAPTVRELFRLRVEQGLGYKSIALQMQRDGHRTPSGRPWTIATVRSILRNRRYTGAEVLGAWKAWRDPVTGKKTKRRDESSGVRVIEDRHPAIVDVETWRAAGVTDGVRPRGKGARRSILVGLIHCERCGRALTRYGRWPYLRCGSQRTGEPCGSRSVREDLVVRRLRAWLSSTDGGAVEALGSLLDGLDGRRDELSSRVDRLSDALRSNEQRTRRCLDAIEAGGEAIALVTRLRDLEHEHDQLEADLQTARVEAESAPTRASLERELRARPAAEWVTRENLRRVISSLIARDDGAIEVHTSVQTVIWLSTQRSVCQAWCPGAGSQLATRKAPVAVLTM